MNPLSVKRYWNPSASEHELLVVTGVPNSIDLNSGCDYFSKLRRACWKRMGTDLFVNPTVEYWYRPKNFRRTKATD